MSTPDSRPEPVAAHVMTSRVVGIVPSAPLRVALRIMRAAGVGHLPLVDDGRCVGLLHREDVLEWLSSGVGTGSLAGTVARTPVPAVSPSDSVRSIARRMLADSTDAVVVAGESAGAGRIVGIVTSTDLVRHLACGSDGPSGSHLRNLRVEART